MTSTISLGCRARSGLYAIARTLTPGDAVNVCLAVTGRPDDLRQALWVLARNAEDLAIDGSGQDVEEIIAAFTPHLTAAERRAAWDQLCEAIQLADEWSQPNAVDLLADPLPWGASAGATTRAAVDEYDAQRDAALAVLVPTQPAANTEAVAA